MIHLDIQAGLCVLGLVAILILIGCAAAAMLTLRKYVAKKYKYVISAESQLILLSLYVAVMVVGFISGGMTGACVFVVVIFLFGVLYYGQYTNIWIGLILSSSPIVFFIMLGTFGEGAFLLMGDTVVAPLLDKPQVGEKADNDEEDKAPQDLDQPHAANQMDLFPSEEITATRSDPDGW